MKLFFQLLFCSFLCDVNAQVEFYDCPKTKKYQYVSNSKLLPRYLLGKDSVHLNWRIDTGNAIVLKYEHHYDCSGTGHLQVIASFIWSIPTTLKKFEINLSQFDSIQTPLLYMTGCGPPCKLYNFEMIDAAGTISGELLNEIWHVRANITMTLRNRVSNVSTSKELVIDGAYVLWKQNRKYRKYHKFYGF